VGALFNDRYVNEIFWRTEKGGEDDMEKFFGKGRKLWKNSFLD
jgi:hypothetical protein